MSREHRQHRRRDPNATAYLDTETTGLNIVITPPSDEEALALIRNKGAIIDAAIKAETTKPFVDGAVVLDPSDAVPVVPIYFSCGAAALKSINERVNVTDTPLERIENTGPTKERINITGFEIMQSPDPEGDERRQKLLADLIEKTRAAQQRNAERLVRERAYFLWEDAGRPDGRSLEFWLLAEKGFKENLYKMLYGKKP